MGNRAMNASAFRNVRAIAVLAPLICVTLAAAGQVKTPSESKPTPSSIANFVDVAEKSGITMKNVFGGTDTKKYIIETTGTGVAIFDYDNDGWLALLIDNGTTLEGFPAGEGPTNHLYRNNH